MARASLYDHSSSKKAKAEEGETTRKPEKSGEERPHPGGKNEPGDAEKKGADKGGKEPLHVKHAKERENLHKAHETERRDMHSSHREEHRKLHTRHEDAHKKLADQQEAETLAQGAPSAEGGAPAPDAGAPAPAPAPAAPQPGM